MADPPDPGAPRPASPAAPATTASDASSATTLAAAGTGARAGADDGAGSGPPQLSVRGAAQAAASNTPLPPRPSASATPSAARPAPGEKRAKLSFAFSKNASENGPKSPPKLTAAAAAARRVSSGSGGGVAAKSSANVLAGFGGTRKGKEKDKSLEAGEVDEDDLRALEELRRSSSVGVGGVAGPSASPPPPSAATLPARIPSLPPKPAFDTSLPPPPPPRPAEPPAPAPPPASDHPALVYAGGLPYDGAEASTWTESAGQNRPAARRRRSVSAGDDELDRRRERGREEAEGERRRRDAERADDERFGRRDQYDGARSPQRGSSYSNGHGYGRGYDDGHGGSYGRSERRNSYGGPPRSRYDPPQDHRGGRDEQWRPDYNRPPQYLSHADQGGVPYGDDRYAASGPSSSRRYPDRQRERDDRRNDRADDRWPVRRDDRRDDRSWGRRDDRDGRRDRGFEGEQRPRISYDDEDRPRDDERHHTSKRQKTERSPSPRRAKTREPSRSPASVADTHSESGTPIQPYYKKSVLEEKRVKELEEQIRAGNVRRDEGSMRNGATPDVRDRYPDRPAPPLPPSHQQRPQHPPPLQPPSHLPPQQTGFLPPPPPSLPQSSFIRPEPIHAPPHTAVPAGSRPASQPSDSVNPSPAVGAPAPPSRDTARTPVAPVPGPSALHAEPLPLAIRSNRSAEDLWMRDMNEAEVDELVARARAEMAASATPRVDRQYVGCSHISEYSLNEKLGEGTFGVVWKGMRGGKKQAVSAAEAEKEKDEEEKLIKVGLRVRKGDVVALKQIIFHNEGDGMPITSVREIRILKMLDHPNVVPVVDIAYEPADAQNFSLGKTFMVFPYMDHDLAGLLENPRVKLETEHIKQYSKQLLEGTAYLHRNRILHRDMKAANLLISNKGQLMIADFGLARSIEAFEKNVEYTSCVVTRWYRPPELLLGEKRYHTPVDMWGVGCIMAEMWHRSPIFPGSSDMDQAVRIFASCGPPTDETMPGWRNLPGVEGHEHVTWANNGRSVRADWAGKANDDLFGDLIDRILVLDPKKRLTANEALDHDWFWTEPFPCEPSRMPTYEASHELDRRKRVQDQHAAFGQPAQQMQQPMHPRPPMPGYGNALAQQPYMGQHASAPFNGPPPPAAFNGPPIAAYNGPPPPMPNPYNAPQPQPYGGGGGMGGGGPHRSYAAAGPPVATATGARPLNGAYDQMRASWQPQQPRPYGAPPAQAGPGRAKVNLFQRLQKK